MKIAFFVHCFFPDHFYGTETYTLELARNYKSLGHEVTVVSAIFQGEPTAIDLVTRYEYQGIPVVCIDKNRIPHTRVKETYYQYEMYLVLERILKEIEPDVVHVTHLINHTSVLLEVTAALGIPTYATFTDFFGFCLNNKLEMADGTLCRGPSANRSNCVACYLKDAARNPREDVWIRLSKTPATAKWIAQAALYGRRLPWVRGGQLDGLIEDIISRPNTLIELYKREYRGAVAPTRFLKEAYEANGISVPMNVVWFGVDIDRSAKPARLSGHVPVIGFIGQIAPHKGADLLIDAYLRLPEKTAELRIYGPDNQDPEYMSLLMSKAKEGHIRFLGTFANEQMAEVLKDIDLLVIPSRWYENSPLVLLNALATHTPVLVSGVAGMTEFVVSGVSGEYFQRGSVDDLESKLRSLLQQPDLLASLSQTTIYDRTSEIMAQDTLKIYSQFFVKNEKKCVTL